MENQVNIECCYCNNIMRSYTTYSIYCGCLFCPIPVSLSEIGIFNFNIKFEDKTYVIKYFSKLNFTQIIPLIGNSKSIVLDGKPVTPSNYQDKLKTILTFY